MKQIVFKTVTSILTIAVMLSSCSCKKNGDEVIPCKNLMLLYSAAFNNIGSDLDKNIEDLKRGYVPSKNSEDVILIASHRPAYPGSYTTVTSPQLIRMYKDKKGSVIMDTLKTYQKGTYLTKKGTLRQVLQDTDELFHPEHCGMIFSSHATGWLPAGYYANSDAYESNSKIYSSTSVQTERLPEGAVPYIERNDFPDGPQVRSIGASTVYDGTKHYSYELSLEDFADDICIHLDYIYFDACLMGGIEVAWQLRNVCDYIGFSQAEVLAEGMDYTKPAAMLLKEKPDIEGVCRAFYEKYAAKSGEEQSATISLIETGQLEGLGALCQELFENYREQISNVDVKSVQPYFRIYYHWFYDLEDILVKSGISAADKARLGTELDKCIKYRAATEYFLPNSGGFKLNSFSGLSMFLPSNGGNYLKDYYKTLEWNKKTNLVK